MHWPFDNETLIGAGLPHEKRDQSEKKLEDRLLAEKGWFDRQISHEESK